MSVNGYAPALERAHHQEVAVSHREGKTSMQAAVYFDRIGNPALTGVGELSGADGDVLPDPYSGTFTYQGENLDTRGMRLVLERQLMSDISATLDYSYGGTLDLDKNDVKLEDAREATTQRYRHQCRRSSAEESRARRHDGLRLTGGPADVRSRQWTCSTLRQDKPIRSSISSSVSLCRECNHCRGTWTCCSRYATCWRKGTCPLWDRMAGRFIWCSLLVPYAAAWRSTSN